MDIKEIAELMISLEDRTVELRDRMLDLLAGGCTGLEGIYALIRMYVRASEAMGVPYASVAALFTHCSLEQYPPAEVIALLGDKAILQMNAIAEELNENEEEEEERDDEDDNDWAEWDEDENEDGEDEDEEEED